MQESYLYVNSRLLRKEKERKRKKFLIFILLILFLVGVVLNIMASFRTPRSVAKNVPAPTPTSTPIQSGSTLTMYVAGNSHTLGAAVSQALAESGGTYAIAVKKLDTGESYYLNSHKSFLSASLYKLWIATVVYNKIQKGELEKDQILTESVESLNKKFGIDKENAEQKEGTISLSISDALTRMITYSDNYSALLLTSKIRLSSVSSFLKENGFSESNVGTTGGDPTTTPSDISIYLEKLYKGELLNPDNTTELIGLLKQQQINGKIPKLIPVGVEIAHKTGELGSISHDAAIVYTPQGDYIIVVMSDSSSKLGADERIADVSKKVYDYFSQK